MYINPCLYLSLYLSIYLYIHDGLGTEALPAGHSTYTVSGHSDGPRMDLTHHSTGSCGPSQSERLQDCSSWAAPAAVAPYRDRAAATGQGLRAGGQFKLDSPLSQ